MCRVSRQVATLQRQAARVAEFLRAVHAPGYLTAKARDLASFAVPATVVTGLFVLSTVLWDRAIDPAGATEAVALRVGEAAAVMLLAGLMWWDVESAWTRLAGVAVPLWVEVSFLEILGRLEGGGSYGIGGFLYFFIFVPFISLPRSLRFNVLLLAAIVALPTALSAGFVDHLDMGVYHAYVWLVYAPIVMILLLFEYLYHQVYGYRRQLEGLASTDPLTGVPNRRHFLEVAGGLLRKARRDGRPVSVLFLDIDHFKPVNDAHGHRAGDRLLGELADALGSVLRAGDLLGRYGGEEFVVYVDGAGPTAARRLAERLRAAAGAIALPDGTGFLSVSIGVTSVAGRTGDDDIEGLIHEADQALYDAKGAGRDRVSVYGARPDDDRASRAG